MANQDTNSTDSPDKMARTACILFFTIVLEEYSTGSIKGYCIVPLAVITICVLLATTMVEFQNKGEHNTSLE